MSAVNRLAIRLDLDGVPVEIPIELIRDVVSAEMPPFVMSGEGLDSKQRAVRLSLKAAMRLFLGWVEGEIVEKGHPIPLPQIPVGPDGEEMDTLAYGVEYILALGFGFIAKNQWRLKTELDDDGVLRVVGFAPPDSGVVEASDFTPLLPQPGQLDSAPGTVGGSESAAEH